MVWRYCSVFNIVTDVIAILVSVFCVANGSITTSYDSYTSVISQFPQTVVTKTASSSSVSSQWSSISPDPSDASLHRTISSSLLTSHSVSTVSSIPSLKASSINSSAFFVVSQTKSINSTLSSTYSSNSVLPNSSLSTINNSFSSQLSDSSSDLSSLSTVSIINSPITSSSLQLLSVTSSLTLTSPPKALSVSSDLIVSSMFDTLSSNTVSMFTSFNTFAHVSGSVIPNQSSNSLSKQTVQQTTQATLSLNSSAIISTTTLIGATTSLNSTTIPSIAVPPTPGKLVMLNGPTLPAGVTLPTTTPNPCGMNGCCTYGLSQLPTLHIFDESKEAGSVLVVMRDVYNVTFYVQVRQPKELIPLLAGVFNITQSGNDHILMLQKKVDLEGLYKLAGEKMDVHEFQLQISCVDQLYSSFIVPPRLLNITIDDADDNMPLFMNTNDGSKGCEVPIYKAETSEVFMGELKVNPQQIQAVDGDLLTRHNISYHVMQSEPEDYHVYFNLNQDTGVINKTKEMNSSDPNKYVIFIQAIEDSPQQKSRVAILSIVVVAPDPPVFISQVNPVARLSVQIACVFVLMAFICGMIVIVHHRYRLSHRKQVHATSTHATDERDVRLPKLAVYTSSNSSLNSAMQDIPTINSPSQVTLDDGYTTQYLELPPRESESQKKRRVIVKKPLDTGSRPSWNAPAPRPKRTSYNPFTPYQKARIK